uniref:Uncharacterized protein n=1 Tax=Graphocephala atropunctata TaxID=36148 RepID=A0A1B6MIA8_9HEMI
MFDTDVLRVLVRRATQWTTGQSWTPSLKSWIDVLIQDNRHITVELIGEKVNASLGTIHNIIHNKLQYKKTCARLVPRQLTDAQQRNPDSNQSKVEKSIFD